VQLDRTLGRDAPLRNALVGDLSGGERKRVQLARALLGGPELIVRLHLADGLDQSQLDAVLARLARRWAADDRVAVLVDSLAVKLVRSDPLS
jgi:ABC-type Mn2+/Zn2+ transport system ATPase subunit